MMPALSLRLNFTCAAPSRSFSGARSHSCTATILFSKIVAVACPEQGEGFGNLIEQLQIIRRTSQSLVLGGPGDRLFVFLINACP